MVTQFRWGGVSAAGKYPHMVRAMAGCQYMVLEYERGPGQPWAAHTYVVSRCKRVERHPHMVTAIEGSPYVLLKGEGRSIRCVKM